MRAVMLSALALAALGLARIGLAGVSSSIASAKEVHYEWCLEHGTHFDCAYHTLAACKAAKLGGGERCERNRE